MNEKYGKVLAIDDNEDILFALKLLLKNYVEVIRTEMNPEIIPDLLSKEQFDVILLDMNFTKDAISGQEGFNWLEKILSIDHDAVVVFITAYGDAEKAVKAIKSGATDFILKPWQNEKLIATVSSAIRLRQSKNQASDLKKKQVEISAIQDQPFHEFIGNSPEMQQVFSTIRKVAKTDANVLILGENGTGKELVARALHRNSLRKDEVFISVDLGSITETLFESELFGYAKGAFTDAKADKSGRFELASGGTLFLDEIGNLSLPMQAKILTTIERREIIRVGSNNPKSIDVRLICATNNNIHDMVKNDTFRQDLLYRINTVEIHLPPLRERTGDIPLLANHFLGIYSKKYRKSIKGLSSETLKKLTQYQWPGNVRELQHALERAVIMSDSDTLQPDDFIISTKSDKIGEIEIDTFNLDDIEKNIIVKVLKQNQGNVTQAANMLGLTRTSLYRRMEKYGL
ncbi:MAG: sigma-54-dependent Fis family transcriptional regulator [Bacteroidetes bacterium GWC2_33_15]|nr:MAG: sigma-54-dependent Fis family transcriptional regulator [Bacteroidetes bacterium GWA2_33_15]OFX48800.1 MAG: sigma-54-dependent Fis family transcriptional regulator [Bacteroidetes bacterium GWC2_33_15]OFX66042.1 MAG: sigma-54-dependent Fis family transcriptional regulator [Bacteroidetes bacterium GWB2_32_14]OFX68196.1 MAG: sigma-54-dependent Fis family transcriptional regulator [Bacteroidetes bacterium GWD2_33_33]HAN17971.1 sigma-54-dependent Fis family transcriptional regulator [Bactero